MDRYNNITEIVPPLRSAMSPVLLDGGMEFYGRFLMIEALAQSPCPDAHCFSEVPVCHKRHSVTSEFLIVIGYIHVFAVHIIAAEGGKVCRGIGTCFLIKKVSGIGTCFLLKKVSKSPELKY